MNKKVTLVRLAKILSDSKVKDSKTPAQCAEYLWTWLDTSSMGSPEFIHKEELDRYYKELRKQVEILLTNGYVKHLHKLELAQKDSIKDKPDIETQSGREQIAKKIIYSAFEKVLPDNMWNASGTKFTVDNNKIVIIAGHDGKAIWKNYKGHGKDMPFTNSTALANSLKEELGL